MNTDFGLAAVKREGASIPVDPKAKVGKEPPDADWMELRIPRKMGRKAVHAMVDRWLDRGRGRGGA